MNELKIDRGTLRPGFKDNLPLPYGMRKVDEQDAKKHKDIIRKHGIEAIFDGKIVTLHLDRPKAMPVISFCRRNGYNVTKSGKTVKVWIESLIQQKGK